MTTYGDHLELVAAGASHDSATYGINRASPLNDLMGFDITKCLPFDVMHTVFEGVASNHINHLLHHVIDECQLIRLRDLNHVISSHDYGYSEVDTKPSPIGRESTVHSNFHFKQSGNATAHVNNSCMAQTGMHGDAWSP